MGTVVDTILTAAVNPGAGAVATVVASGDSLAVKMGNQSRNIFLEGLIRQGATAGFIQVVSPALHDNVNGIKVKPNESPSIYTLPAESDQVLTPGDNLVVKLAGGAAETDLGLLQLYYEDLPNQGARLHRYSEISGLIKYIKPQQVNVVSSAVIGGWSDTAINATEDVLHPAKDYAVLGYVTDTNLAFVGIKGGETANLRIGGPGTTNELVTSHYFVNMDAKNGRPWVPVFNSGARGSTFVSVAASTASVAAVVTLILAELSSNLPN